MNPAASVKPVAKEVARDRVLTDDEIRWFWQACDKVGYPWGPFGKLSLLTGQRRQEIAAMPYAEIEGDLWSLPADRVKNGRAHDVPLSTAALDVLASIPLIAGSGLVFTTTGETPVSGFAKGHARLAEKMVEIATKERNEPVDIPHWTFHDLRRTAATGLARLGIPVRVTEAVLNHVKAEISELTQFEASPAEYPPVEGVTGDLLATCWQRIEHFISRRWGVRSVVWTLTSCGGEWQPPLGPLIAVSEAFRWRDGNWQPYTLKRGPFGLLLPPGHVQLDASVGTVSLTLPASVEAAVQRLAAYLEAESAVPAGARSYRADVGQLSESISADPAHMAKALQNSGAADLLRSYRRASHEPA